MREVTHCHWGSTDPHMYINGNNAIDGYYVCDCIKDTSCKILSFHKSAGDHQSILLGYSLHCFVFDMYIRFYLYRKYTSSSVSFQ